MQYLFSFFRCFFFLKWTSERLKMACVLGISICNAVHKWILFILYWNKKQPIHLTGIFHFRMACRTIRYTRWRKGKNIEILAQLNVKCVVANSCDKKVIWMSKYCSMVGIGCTALHCIDLNGMRNGPMNFCVCACACADQTTLSTLAKSLRFRSF